MSHSSVTGNLLCVANRAVNLLFGSCRRLRHTSAHEVSPRPKSEFKPEKVAVVTKTTRYEFEQQRYRYAGLSEEDLKHLVRSVRCGHPVCSRTFDVSRCWWRCCLSTCPPVHLSVLPLLTTWRTGKFVEGERVTDVLPLLCLPASHEGLQLQRPAGETQHPHQQRGAYCEEPEVTPDRSRLPAARLGAPPLKGFF